MNSKKLAYALWTWSSTFAVAGLILFISTIPNLTISANTPLDNVIKVVYQMSLYAVFFLLLYRSILSSLRFTVKRLSKWRSKQEANEDAEFVLIIETLIVTVTVLFTVILAVFDAFLETTVPGRNVTSIDQLRDVLVSTMAALLMGLIVYTMPVVGEFEVALRNKIKKEFGNSKQNTKAKTKTKKTPKTTEKKQKKSSTKAEKEK